MPTLFDPIIVGSLKLANRIFMAPMTRLRCGPEAVPGPLVAEYYGQRATAGLIITEGTSPSLRGRGYMGQPGIWNDAQVAGWAGVTDAVHRSGGRIALQIHHAGRLSHPSLTGGELPVGPSAIAAKGEVHTANGGKELYPAPHALSAAEISRVIQEFGDAAGRAAKAGFDFVELHAANGYLPHEFLSTNANARTDEWGSSIANRCKFTLDAIDAMTAATGVGRVGIKLTIGPFTPHDIVIADEQELYPYLAGELSKRGVAFIEAQRPIINWGVPPIDFDPFALFNKRFSGVLIGGAMFERPEADAMIAAGKLDAVAFGRLFIANPDLPARLAASAEMVDAPQSSYYYAGSGDPADGYITFAKMTP